VAIQRLGVQAHGDVDRPIDRWADGKPVLGRGDVEPSLLLTGEGYRSVRERSLRVDPHEPVALEATEDESLRGDEPHGQPLRHADGRVARRAEAKLVAVDGHRKLGPGPLSDPTLQDLAQQHLVAGLDPHVPADRQALATERRLDRKGPAVDGQRGWLKRVLEVRPQRAHALDALAQAGDIWRAGHDLLGQKSRTFIVIGESTRVEGRPRSGLNETAK
jgi:hypothetical protein